MPAGYTYIMGSHTARSTLASPVNSPRACCNIRTARSRVSPKATAVPACSTYEKFDNIRIAIGREKQLKGWRREKKLTLIRTTNPEFKDLAEQVGWKLITALERIDPLK